MVHLAILDIQATPAILDTAGTLVLRDYLVLVATLDQPELRVTLDILEHQDLLVSQDTLVIVGPVVIPDTLVFLAIVDHLDSAVILVRPDGAVTAAHKDSLVTPDILVHKELLVTPDILVHKELLVILGTLARAANRVILVTPDSPDILDTLVRVNLDILATAAFRDSLGKVDIQATVARLGHPVIADILVLVSLDILDILVHRA